MIEVSTDTLLAAARAARAHAIAAYSGFAVGAALAAADGTIVTGVNVENATYGLSICAERLAIFKALSDGRRRFSRIAIVADGPQCVYPCGACRQILWEFAGDIEIVLGNANEITGRGRLAALFPSPFDARNLP